MTPRDKLVTVREGAEADEVQRLLHQHRIEKILVVSDDFDLRGMITVKDFDKAESYPHACKDSYGRLRVGASVGTRRGHGRARGSAGRGRCRCAGGGHGARPFAQRA
jgi:CBS-domain-containing membrane protein